MEIKQFGIIEKADTLNEGEVEVIVSTDAIDSYGERINVSGINLKDFKKNPVVLWAHDGWNLPIAKCTKIWKEGNKLMARAVFYLKDDFPAKVYGYVKDGFIKGVSIGGSVDEWGHDGMTISRMTMKEFSFCSIPANGEALVTQKAFSDVQRSELNGLARMYARKVLAMGEDQLQSSIKVMKDMVAALEEVAAQPVETEEERPSHIRLVLRQAQTVDQQAERIIKVIKRANV